jgi:hypothetical protein
VTADKIEMSDWEVHDFSVEIVSASILKSGGEIISKQPSLRIDPSIWFRDKNGTHFVVIRGVRHPVQAAQLLSNIEVIKVRCSKMSRSGFFASVVLANSEDPFDPNAAVNGNFFPLYRGHGFMPKFQGLVSV